MFDILGDALMKSIIQICVDILEERFWRSFGGDQMRVAGNALALGSMPRFLLTVSLPEVIKQLCSCALITDKTLQ